MLGLKWAATAAAVALVVVASAEICTDPVGIAADPGNSGDTPATPRRATVVTASPEHRLHIAVSNGNVAAVEDLIRSGADPLAKREGKTPLMEVCAANPVTFARPGAVCMNGSVNRQTVH